VKAQSRYRGIAFATEIVADSHGFDQVIGAAIAPVGRTRKQR